MALDTAPQGTARKEVGGFLVVGVLAVIVDFGLFNGLLLVGWPVWDTNAVALFLSMTFAFVGNYKWTFAHREIKSLLHAYSAFAGINLLAVDGFILHQGIRHRMQLIHMVDQNLLST